MEKVTVLVYDRFRDGYDAYRRLDYEVLPTRTKEDVVLALSKIWVRHKITFNRDEHEDVIEIITNLMQGGMYGNSYYILDAVKVDNTLYVPISEMNCSAY